MLRASIQTIFNNYLHYKSISNSITKDAEVYKVINKDLPEYLQEYLNDDQYKVDASAGKGIWADVPWVGIFDKEITTSAQRGYYICYLFKKDMTALYLTIIHSITKDDFNTSFNRESINNVVNTKREELISKFPKVKEYDDIGIKLETPANFGDSARAIKYSASTIVYKEYDAISLPDEEELKRDLKIFLEMYKKMKEEKETMNTQPFNIEQVINYIHSEGFVYENKLIENTFLSIKAKPFTILSGISGTGKTKIVELFAAAVGATSDNGRYNLIPVRPDWSDSSDLLGYKDLKNDFIPGPLTKIIERASEDLSKPYFVVLDEMNLARVEYYFSDFLSIIESRKFNAAGEIKTDTLVEYNGKEYGIPENLYIIGTVNMDETTHPFSKKVLDRANAIEFNEVHLTNFSMLETDNQKIEPVDVTNEYFKSKYIQLVHAKEHMDIIEQVSKELEEINKHLATIYAQVAYRVRDEIVFYMSYNKEYDLLSYNEAMDFCIMQKILPRISGAGEDVEKLLESLITLFDVVANDAQVKYPRSVAKLKEMQARYNSQGFVSYWVS